MSLTGKLPRGVVARVARELGLTHQGAKHRLYKMHDPAAIRLARAYTAQIRKERRAGAALIERRARIIEREVSHG